MSAEEFWKDDPQLFVSYRTFFINKKQREVSENDYKSWLLGLYIHDGNSKLFSSLKQFLGNIISSMFKGKKDNSKIESYPSKPYSELEKENKAKELKQKTEKENRYIKYEKSLEYYGTLKQQYIKRLRKKGD